MYYLTFVLMRYILALSSQQTPNTSYFLFDRTGPQISYLRAIYVNACHKLCVLIFGNLERSSLVI